MLELIEIALRESPEFKTDGQASAVQSLDLLEGGVQEIGSKSFFHLFNLSSQIKQWICGGGLGVGTSKL